MDSLFGLLPDTEWFQVRGIPRGIGSGKAFCYGTFPRTYERRKTSEVSEYPYRSQVGYPGR